MRAARAARGGPARAMAIQGAEMPHLVTRLRHDAWRALSAGPFYHHTLIGPAPADLRLRIGERWPGDSKRGHAILDGDIEFGGELVRNPAPVWLPRGAGEEWLAHWHGFGWLADLVGGGPDAREAARALVQSWLTENTAWRAVGWRSGVAATRRCARQWSGGRRSCAFRGLPTPRARCWSPRSGRRRCSWTWC